MRGRLVTALAVALLVAGACLLAYPAVSDWNNSRVQSGLVEDYTAKVSELDPGAKAAALDAARAYNERLADYGVSEGYEGLLDVAGTGVIGYVSIPKIGVELAVYPSTAGDAALDSSAEHMEATSLPIGGESTHSVIYAHRGLPRARLFTDLDQLEPGDLFQVTSLEETLTYRVCEILVVEPDDTSALRIVPGEDLCTLLTCTPYGVNTHRLLVRGTRVPTPEHELEEGLVVDRVTIMAIAAAIVLAAALAIVLVRRARRARRAAADEGGGSMIPVAGEAPTNDEEGT